MSKTGRGFFEKKMVGFLAMVLAVVAGGQDEYPIFK